MYCQFMFELSVLTSRLHRFFLSVLKFIDRHWPTQVTYAHPSGCFTKLHKFSENFLSQLMFTCCFYSSRESLRAIKLSWLFKFQYWFLQQKCTFLKKPGVVFQKPHVVFPKPRGGFFRPHVFFSEMLKNHPWFF